MYPIGVDLSQRQRLKLKHGEKVRVKKGRGLCLIVNPENYNIVHRAFRKNKGIEIQLTPDEIEENRAFSPEVHHEQMDEDLFEKDGMSGEGLFSNIGRKLKNTGKTISRSLSSANTAAKKNPISRTIIKTVAPMLAKELTTAGLTYVGVDPTMAKSLGNVSSSGTKAGLKAGGYGLYAGAGLSSFDKLRNQSIGNLYAGDHDSLMGSKFRSSQRGLNYIRGRGSFVGGEISYPHPALSSQPFAQNYNMQYQLPPQYQKLHNGTDQEGF